MKYELLPNEYIILKSSRISDGGFMSSYNDELILTNFNIVFIDHGSLGGIKDIIMTPIKSVKVYEDRAQAFFANNPKTNCAQLQVYLQDGRELSYDFYIDGRKDVVRWVNEINKLVTGDESNIVYDEKKERGAINTVAGVFKTAMGMEPQLAERNRTNVKRSTQTCVGCGAPVTGAVGRITRCEYCDLEQVIK